MANGASRLISAQLSKPKTPKGSALKSAIGSAFAPKKIFSVTGLEKQTLKGKK